MRALPGYLYFIVLEHSARLLADLRDVIPSKNSYVRACAEKVYKVCIEIFAETSFLWSECRGQAADLEGPLRKRPVRVNGGTRTFVRDQ